MRKILLTFLAFFLSVNFCFAMPSKQDKDFYKKFYNLSEKEQKKKRVFLIEALNTILCGNCPQCCDGSDPTFPSCRFSYKIDQINGKEINIFIISTQPKEKEFENVKNINDLNKIHPNLINQIVLDQLLIIGGVCQSNPFFITMIDTMFDYYHFEFNDILIESQETGHTEGIYK